MANRYRYQVALQKDGDGFMATVPSLPGIASQGNTEDEALENIKVALTESIRIYLQEDGSIPSVRDPIIPDYSKVFSVKIFV